MKNICVKLIGLLLAVPLLCSQLSVPALAAEENRFILVAEAEGRLVIAPEYVSYADGATIGEALTACENHDFAGLSDGIVYSIDGAVGNYTRSDQDGNSDLARPASEVTYYRFSENSNSVPSEGLMQLMKAMADYLLEDSDVRAAAKEAYDTAYSHFVGASSEMAEEYAIAIAEAISDYRNSITGSTHAVTFSGFTASAYSGIEITAENAYGKIWKDDGDGVMKLPVGAYDFHISWNGLHIEGTLNVEADQTVEAVFPEGQWLVTDTFLLSATNNPASTSSSQEVTFEDGLFDTGNWSGRTYTVAVKDTFVGSVYAYAQYDENIFKDVVPSLIAVYTNSAGESVEKTLAFESKITGAAAVLSRGAEGNQVIYRVSTTDAKGYTVSQDYTVVFTRIPTLTGITVTDQNGRAQAATELFSDEKTQYTYKVLDTVTALTLIPKPLDDTYSVLVNGEEAASEGVAVSITGDTAITVQVVSGEAVNTYTLNILPGEGSSASFISYADEFRVVNSEGVELPSEIEKEVNGQWRYKYILVPGETYYYEATKGTYYHVKDTFTLGTNSTIYVDVPTEDWLTEFALGNKRSTQYKGNLTLDRAFAAGNHEYTVTIPDTESAVYVWASASSDTTISVLYDQISGSATYHGKLLDRTLVELCQEQGYTIPKLPHVLMNYNPYGNTVTIRLTRQDDNSGIVYYQDYVVTLSRTLSLKGMSAACGTDTVLLNHSDGSSSGYDPTVFDYTVNVPMAADSLTINVEHYTAGSYTVYGEEDTGYEAAVNGVPVPESGMVSIPLSGDLEPETISVTVTNSKVPDLSTTYTITVQKAAPTEVSLDLAPGDALMCVHEEKSGNRVWPENGVLRLSEGFFYRYTLTKNGYVGQSGTLEVTRNDDGALILRHNSVEDIPVNTASDGGVGTASLKLELVQAEQNSKIKPELTSQWSNFRGSESNNGVTAAPIPISVDDSTLYWAAQLGVGYGEDAVGCPILVDGDLVTYSGDQIYRVDTISGEVLATGQMDHNSSFSITTPTYYEGMIFMALSDGMVQAFNADTLESLWIYESPNGGQPNSPITVCDGYLYTGFWYSETGDADFVCLSVTDEDPENTKEVKPATWYHTQKGGFYWAGAYVTEEYLLVGTDDGYGGYEHQTSQLLLLESKTGKLLDSWDGLNADIRSTVVYDSDTDACYFTSKGGSFCSVRVVDGKLTDKWTVALDNGASSTPMSTSTPVVYNGRAYIGVCGTGQFSAYSGHNITVVDLKAKTVAYTAETQGYPQTSGLLTTAYEEESGYVYVYFFDNMTPGKLRVLRDKPGQTAMEWITEENGKSTVYALFTPVGDQAQYAICSPIVDEFGTVYFKNDSGNLMAFGSAIKELTVSGSYKTDYFAGEIFDPTGMTVMATYSNGMTRDVTNYVTWSEEALAVGDTIVTIQFPYVEYHNQENSTAMEAGIITKTPTVEVPVNVTAAEAGIRIEDDLVTVTFDTEVLDGWTVYAASYNADGKMFEVTSAPGTGSYSLSLTLSGVQDAYEVRVFVLGDGYAPMLERLSTLDQTEGE